MQTLGAEWGSQLLSGLPSRIRSRLPGFDGASPLGQEEHLLFPCRLQGASQPFGRLILVRDMLSVLHQA